MKTIEIYVGRFEPSDPEFSTPVKCFVCETPHKANGVAILVVDDTKVPVVICERCMASDDLDEMIADVIETTNVTPH